jgi:hypothetical protein
MNETQTRRLAFARARLDDDEQVARTAAAANPGAPATHWSAEQVDYRSDSGVRGTAWAIRPEWVRGVTIAISPADVQPRFTTHIARHDPARVLREAAFHHALLNEIERDLADDETDDMANQRLKEFCGIYSDHEDYPS